MKKYILVMSIGLLTAAGVTATVMSTGNNSTTKKETTTKETTIKKEKKCSRSTEKKSCGLYRLFNS